MIIDARMVPANETVETEVCIIGAGPAGITLAREFIGRDFRVCLLESGGEQPDKDTQSLCAGEMDGALFQDLKESRYRQFGGTANKWHIQITPNQIGGRCGPFEAIDFEQRDEVPYSGWPFGKAHLDPYYERAQSICKLGPYVYDAKDWQGSEPLPMPLNAIASKLQSINSRLVLFLQKNIETRLTRLTTLRPICTLMLLTSKPTML